jgi:hypothetical protein
MHDTYFSQVVRLIRRTTKFEPYFSDTYWIYYAFLKITAINKN